MKIINKTNTTLIFDDINFVLTYDKNGKSVEIDDCDVKSSPTLKHYIERGLVEIESPDEESIVYKSIKNRSKVIKNNNNSVNSIRKVSQKSENDSIIGGQSSVINSRVYKVSHDSSINKFRETGKMDISYSGPCFSDSTIIITSDGVKFIKDIDCKDIVLTHKSNWKKVTEIHRTQYKNSLCNIKPSLSSGIPIECTPDHLFYINRSEKEQWEKSSFISEKDFLICPNLSFKDGKEFILFSNFIDIDKNEEKNGFPSAIRLSEKFMKFLWIYISSGFIKGDDNIIFKIDKKDFEDFVNLMENIFSLKIINYEENNRSFTCYYCSKSLVSFLSYFCYINGEKVIPSFIFRKKYSNLFLKTVLFNKTVGKNGVVSMSSKYPLIIWGLRLLFLESSILSSIQYIISRKSYCLTFSLRQYEKVLKEKSIINNSYKWVDSSSKDRPVTYEIFDENIYIPVFETEIGRNCDYVYNIDVEDDHTYTANFCSVHNCYDAGGYAKMNRNYMFGLSEKEDVNLKLDIPKDLSLRIQIEEEDISKLNHLRNSSVGEDCVKICGSTATTVLGGSYRILYTMMETETVHPQYIEKCDSANEVWLPSDWCINKFKESGLKTKIYKMPIGVDLDLYKEGLSPITFGGKEKGFVFISVFGWSLRKGYDILLRSYFEEFTKDDDVSLVICSRFAGKTDPTSKQVIKDQIKQIESSVKKKNKPSPPLLISDVIPEKMMPNIYNSSHAYICISRGEGFGMPYCEASMCGLPIIASDYSGHKDFLSDNNSFLVKNEGVSVNPGAEWVSYYYKDMPMANFGDKSVEQTKAHMRYVYENYAIAKEKNKILQSFIKENYNWNNCIDIMHNRLIEIYKNVKHRGER